MLALGRCSNIINCITAQSISTSTLLQINARTALFNPAQLAILTQQHKVKNVLRVNSDTKCLQITQLACQSAASRRVFIKMALYVITVLKAA